MPIVLMCGAGLWVISEIMELLQGGFTPENSMASTLAFALVAIGLWALWPRATGNGSGRAGIILVSIGMALFALVAALTIKSGAVNDTVMAGTPLFLAAGAAVCLGALALVFWLVTTSPFPNWMGWVLLATTAVTLAVAFVPALVGLQPVSNVVLALVLGGLGWLARDPA